MAPTKDATKVLIGYGNGYIAPLATAPPADTVNLDGTWPAGWVHYGYTEEGLTLNWERDVQDHYVEEQDISVFSTVGESTLTFEFGMAETTMENLRYALGGGTITTQAAASGLIGKKTLVISDRPSEYMFGFEIKNEFGHWERWIIPRGLFTGSLEVNYRRSEDKRIYTAEFKAACRVNEISIVSKTALALA